MREPDHTTRQVLAFLRHKRPWLAFFVAYQRVIVTALGTAAMLIGLKIGR